MCVCEKNQNLKGNKKKKEKTRGKQQKTKKTKNRITF